MSLLLWHYACKTSPSAETSHFHLYVKYGDWLNKIDFWQMDSIKRKTLVGIRNNSWSEGRIRSKCEEPYLHRCIFNIHLNTWHDTMCSIVINIHNYQWMSVWCESDRRIGRIFRVIIPHSSPQNISTLDPKTMMEVCPGAPGVVWVKQLATVSDLTPPGKPVSVLSGTPGISRLQLIPAASKQDIYGTASFLVYVK